MAYVPPEYPGGIPEFAEIWPPADDVHWMFTTAWDAMVKELRAALIELGTDPAGTFATVKARLDAPVSKIADGDGDTKVDTEESADEDIIRMDVAAVEAFKLNSDGILDLPKQSRCRAYRTTSAQTITKLTDTKVQLNAESYDNQNEYDKDVNYRFTAKKAGKYLITATMYYTTAEDAKRYQARLKKNGGLVANSLLHASHTAGVYCSVTDIIEMAINDYIESWTYHGSAANKDIYNAEAYTFMSIHKLS